MKKAFILGISLACLASTPALTKDSAAPDCNLPKNAELEACLKLQKTHPPVTNFVPALIPLIAGGGAAAAILGSTSTTSTPSTN